MEILNIGEIWYPVTTLGYGKRLGIWFQGCQKNCIDCISPEFKAKANGKLLHIEDLGKNIPQDCMIDGLTISGGEPFDQPQGLLKLVQWFENRYSDDILIFTGYTLEELHKKNSLIIEKILNHISVLIDGEYIEDLKGQRPRKIKTEFIDGKYYLNGIRCSPEGFIYDPEGRLNKQKQEVELEEDSSEEPIFGDPISFDEEIPF